MLRTLKSAAKGTGKFLGRAAAIGTMGAIGVGMGIAGDDLEDVLTIGATGAALGATLAPSVGRSMANSNLAQSIGSDIQHITHGGSTNDAEVARQSEELYRSGVNEFVFDFSALNAKFIPVLLNKFFEVD